MSISIVASMPPRPLSPNSRAHWAAVSRCKKLYRDELFWLTKEAIQKGLRLPDSDLIALRLTCHPRAGAVAPDDDNVSASFKAGRDGMAQAFGIDDKRFRMMPVQFADPVKGGRIIVKLAPLTIGIDPGE